MKIRLAFLGLCVILVTACTAKGPADAEILQKMKSDPVISAVMTANPQAEDIIVKAISDSAEGPADAREQRLKEKMQPLIRAHLQYRMRHLDDQMTSKFAHAMSQVAMQGSVHNSPRCLPEIKPGKTFLDIIPAGESQELIQDIAKMTPDLSPAIATKEVLATAMAERLPDIAARGRLTTDQVMTAYTNEAATTPEVTCKVLSGTLASLAALPPAQGAPLIRALMNR